MLIRFAVENFRSIRDRAEISFVASAMRDVQADPVHVSEVSGDLLPACAIFGPNASGKSNFIRALSFLKRAVVFSHATGEPGGGTPVESFALDAESKAKPTTFELEFLVSGVRYIYELMLTRKVVVREAIHAYPLGRRQTWFERNGQEFDFGSRFRGENRTIASLTRDNSLFLSAAAQNNHESLAPVFGYFRDQINYFERQLSAHDSFAKWLASKPTMKKKIVDLIRAADVGISDVIVRTIQLTEEDMKFRREFRQFLNERLSVPPANADDEPTRHGVSFVHKGSARDIEPFEFSDESTGTQLFLSVLPSILNSLESGALLVVDEVGGELHPLLAARLLKLFQSKKSNSNGAQILFTCHDPTLLRSLRRDQVWFSEKSADGATSLFPLSDIRTKPGENLETRYLRGVYGAIPFLSGSSWWEGEEGHG
jgi:uncharacterized protein